ncbi:hypothetical protein Aple_093650 [Acrocarpospora pleiomorpha]|uniref:Uncharacterized protein n=1 Tax=Acrocarpospora pleiomorpha TaxID=90975 RepID=A0A5M3XZV0_9ACTN|nr:hypothetical protein Aple_093650 [Acrocarpospora pleiomorpha]
MIPESVITTGTLIGPPTATSTPIRPPGTPISPPGRVTGRFGTLTGFLGVLTCLPDTSTGLVNTLAAHVPAATGLLPGTGQGPRAAGGPDTRGPDTGLLSRAEPGVGGFGGGLGGAGTRRCGVCHCGLCHAGTRDVGTRGAGTRGAGVPARIPAKVAAGVGCRDSSSAGIQQQDRATGIAGNTAGFGCPGTSPGWRCMRAKDRRTAEAGIEGTSGGGVVTVQVGWSAGVQKRKGGGTVVGQQHRA